MNKIVVGVDGSRCSQDALRWAVEEAARRGDKVVAVHAWDSPPVSTYHEAMRVIEIEEPLREAAAEVLEAAVAEVAPGPQSVPIERVVVKGPARTRGLQRPSPRIGQPAVRTARSMSDRCCQDGRYAPARKGGG